jgi:hypothetical protein
VIIWSFTEVFTRVRHLALRRPEKLLLDQDGSHKTSYDSKKINPNYNGFIVRFEYLQLRQLLAMFTLHLPAAEYEPSIVGFNHCAFTPGQFSYT